MPDTQTVGAPSSAGAKQKTIAPPQVKKKTQEEEVPMYKVIMLWDDEYQEAPVIEALKKVIPQCKNRGYAQQCYKEASMKGRSLLTVVAQEIAEHYALQLKRSDPMVYAKIEEDK